MPSHPVIAPRVLHTFITYVHHLFPVIIFLPLPHSSLLPFPNIPLEMNISRPTLIRYGHDSMCCSDEPVGSWIGRSMMRPPVLRCHTGLVSLSTFNPWTQKITSTKRCPSSPVIYMINNILSTTLQEAFQRSGGPKQSAMIWLHPWNHKRFILDWRNSHRATVSLVLSRVDCWKVVKNVPSGNHV